MAGASSEAGYLNIRTADSSSHPEIEPKIEAVEATGDSDEVCGLERKECDDIMEHLKNNPGLVVQSLGPEGRIVLHVAVMAGETKKPKPPASECTDKGFSEAAHDSDWYCALQSKDCKALMSLLQANPCLIAQTGPEGRTVLHAAAERGCLQLLEQVSDLFKDKLKFVDEMSGLNIEWYELLSAMCGTFEADASDMAWFTCPGSVWEALTSFWSLDLRRVSSALRSNPNASQNLRDKLVEIMQGETSKKAFESLEKEYEDDMNYNFVLDRKELQFHYACGILCNEPSGATLHREPAADYLKTIVGGCLELGPSESVKVLTYLLQLHNAQGRTPFHAVLSHMYGRGECFARLWGLVPPGDAYKECLNAKDVRGWTALHYVVAIGNHGSLKALLKDERIDANARTTSIKKFKSDEYVDIGMTALHLAILNNDAKSVELLLQCARTNVNALLYRYIECGYERINRDDEDMMKDARGIISRDEDILKDIRERRSYWSPLQLAAIMGLSDVVRALLGSKDCNIYDDGKFQNNNIELSKHFRGISALLLAAASGNSDTLRLFLDNPMFNSLVKFEGATALHYATNAMIPTARTDFRNSEVGPILTFMDLGEFYLFSGRYKEELQDMKLTTTSYLGREACITMLLQAGVDIWEKDDYERFAEPGPEAPEEAHLWWHEKIARETLEAKKSLNDAANAISVIAALVATASFVGPLQPPLGYGSVEDRVQDTYLSIRVFMVSNILSFYLAVASIMFAVVPSLPMPQEGIYAEWQRTKRTVGVAIFFLLMSVLGILISFGAASNSVVSEYYSWQHVGLSFYSTLVGAFICILGISLFFLRLLRLVFNGNEKIRYLYKTFVKF